MNLSVRQRENLIVPGAGLPDGLYVRDGDATKMARCHTSTPHRLLLDDASARPN